MNPDSSAPTHLHADEIRRRGLFREVACCFWKEEPNMREVYEMVESEVIYIVPNFISEGYFCQQVLPRELRLDGPVTHRDGKTFHYCDPVGIHPNMTRLLLQRADEVAPGVPRAETSLIIVGHGTNLNENSTKAIQDQVKLIREGGYGFAEVVDAYMEEAPFVADWSKMTTAANVVVVPFFIADGLHSFQDIPVLLGMREETGAALSEIGLFYSNPHHLHGRNLYYSGAIGTEPLMAEVILDQVHDFDAKHAVTGGRLALGCLNQKISTWLDEGREVMGEVLVKVKTEDRYSLRHVLDRDCSDLAPHAGAIAAREIARCDAAGKFRPLHSAPTMKRGWELHVESLEELRLALDFFYPAAVGCASAHEAGSLASTPLRELLGRQTGMYRFTNTISDEQAFEMVKKTCAAKNCQRRILWPLTPEQPFPEDESKAQAGAIPLLCIEACPHIVSAARKSAKEAFEAKEAQRKTGST
jgi:sirohydrochlorin cobaltochelatase